MTEGGDTAGLPVLIAGGGIGGLATALALSRRGVASTVLEAASEFGEVGAGFQIGPNGSHILRSWGLEDALAAEAGRPQRLCIHDGITGRLLTALPLGAYVERRYGAPYYVAERRLIHRLMLNALRARPDVTLATGFRVAGFEERDAAVEAVSEDGRRMAGRALIGADGVRSRVRSQLFGVEAAFSQRIAWRATAPLSSGLANDSDVHLWLGPKAHLVHYRCGPSGPFNAVAVVEDQGAEPLPHGFPGEAARPHLRSFADWAQAAQDRLAPFANWTPWPLMELPPLPRWSAGRVALLGDAAHPLLPFLASGAVAAIEDAAILATQWAKHADHPERALHAYESARIPRLGRIIRGSARMGGIYHMQGPMRLARNLVLAAAPPALLLARNDWLYGYCAVGSGESPVD
jgi:salicylate hydroxylase